MKFAGTTHKKPKLIVMQQRDIAIKMSSYLKTLYINTHYITERDEWPPDQPKHFTTLVFLQHENQPSQKCIIALEEQNASGEISAIMSLTNRPTISQHKNPLQEHLSQSTVTKSIPDLLKLLENPTTNPRTLLIEGAPGIGKTFLLKHIAFEWAHNKVLKFSQFLFLLCLRDPAVQKMSSIDNLACYFFKQAKYAITSDEVNRACGFNSDGRNIIFLLDGYDELPEKLQKNSFIADILNHKIFPASGIVITSRPYATAHLHGNVACLISILGFSEEDRRKYIEESFKDHPEKAQELLEYLNYHLSIDNLCYIPFHLTALVFLYKRGFALPHYETQLYESFIITTIRRYLSRHNINPKLKFKNLNDLPDPYGTIIDKLAALSYSAIEKQQIFFTLDEITTACPEITSIPEGKNGLGLLQAVQHFDTTDVSTTVNFLHLSLQEFLGAYHVACLSPDKQLQVLHENFFNSIYKNTFLLYVGITKGQHRAFKHFLYGGGKNLRITSWLFDFRITSRLFDFSTTKKKISSEFFSDIRFCLYLIKCLREAGDVNLCREIASHPNFIYHDKPVIAAASYRLCNRSVEGLCIILTCVQELHAIDIFSCVIIPNFLQKIHKTIQIYTPAITVIKLVDINPCLTVCDSHYLADIVIICKTKILIVDNNELNCSDWVNIILSHNHSVLEELSIGGNRITSSTAIDLFSIFTKAKYKNMSYLGIYYNLIDDQAVHKIVKFFQQDCYLKEVYFDDNELSENAVFQIICALKSNKTLNTISFGCKIPFCERIKKKVKKIQLEINKERTPSNQFCCKLYETVELPNNSDPPDYPRYGDKHIFFNDFPK